MANPEPFDDVLLELELLKATLAVRDHFLRTVVTDIYENTGQLLSAVRVQLALLQKKVPDDIIAEVKETGKTVSQTIANLRAMGKNFYPEELLRTGTGLVEAITEAANARESVNRPANITVLGKPYALELSKAILFFSSILQVISLIHEQLFPIATINILYTEMTVHVKFTYEGKIMIRLLTTAGLQSIGGRWLEESAINNNHTLTVLVPGVKQ